MVAESPDDKPKQGLTAQALDALLAILDSDRDRAGEKYEEIRLKLTKYFEWEGCVFAEEQADETINRVARAVQQGKDIVDLRAYFFGVARMIHFESLRNQEKQRRVLAELSAAPALAVIVDGNPSETALGCLERCLETLPGEARDLITAYYQGDQVAKIRNRRDLARALGLASNALRNRALRLRAKLETCLVKCMKQRDGLADSATNIYGQR
jgi:DNA-directed RNA polymerase specialized sigma24 family protein